MDILQGQLQFKVPASSKIVSGIMRLYCMSENPKYLENIKCTMFYYLAIVSPQVSTLKDWINFFMGNNFLLEAIFTDCAIEEAMINY